MESFASARPCDWKKSQFIAAEQEGCFFFLFLIPELLGKRFHREKGGSEVPGETPGGDLGLRNAEDQDVAGIQPGGFAGVTWEREEPGRRGENHRGGEQRPSGRGRTVALPGKIFAGVWGWGWQQGCSARQKCQEAIVGVPGVFADAGTHSCARDTGGLSAGKVTGFAPGRSVGCVGAGADAPSVETWAPGF